jgi:hypothetical protein
MFETFDVFERTPGCDVYGHYTMPSDAHYVMCDVAFAV